MSPAVSVYIKKLVEGEQRDGYILLTRLRDKI